MSLLKKLAGETAIYGISSILGRLVNWVILTPYLTRAFSTGEYGIVNELYTYIALLLVFFTYRLETAFFRFGRQVEDRQRAFTTASLSILGSSLPFLLILVALSPAIAAWLEYPDQVGYVVLFSVIVALDALASIPFARLRLDGRPILFAAIKLSSIFLNMLLLFLFLEVAPWLQQTHWAHLVGWYEPSSRIAYVFWANLLASAATLLCLLPLYFKLRPQHAEVWFDGALWRKMMAYGLPLILAGLAGVVNQLIGVPLLKAWASPDLKHNLSVAGIYAASAKLAILMNLFIQAFNYAAEPFFFRYSAQNDSKAIFAQVAQAFALVGCLAFLGIVFYMDLIQYFLGKDFRGGLGVLPILLIANFFLGLYFNFAMSFKLTDQTPVGGYIALGGMIITLALNWWLIPWVGYYGPAWASLACYGFMALASYWMGRKIMPVQYPLKKMARYLWLALATYAISLYARPYLPEGLAITLVFNTLLLLAYTALVYKLDGAWWKKSDPSAG